MYVSCLPFSPEAILFSPSPGEAFLLPENALVNRFFLASILSQFSTISPRLPSLTPTCDKLRTNFLGIAGFGSWSCKFSLLHSTSSVGLGLFNSYPKHPEFPQTGSLELTQLSFGLNRGMSVSCLPFSPEAILFSASPREACLLPENASVDRFFLASLMLQFSTISPRLPSLMRTCETLRTDFLGTVGFGS